MNNFWKLSGSRGFTLIELLVVISIIGVLTSVTLASVSQAREKAQNSARVQALRQIDLAIKMYELNNDGKVPLLNNRCGVGNFSDMPSSNCRAVQTAEPGTVEYNNWLTLQDELSDYIPKLPVDPCGTDCEGITGYTYEAPAEIYYQCFQTSYCDTSKVTESDYTNFAVLKDHEMPTGYSTVGVFFDSPPVTGPYN